MDITFDLNTGSYCQYRKPNNDTRYVNAKSNHPPSILKQIPADISKRISTNSSNKQIFQNAATYYNNILKYCGYKEKIQLQQFEHQQTQPNSNRSRNIIWFNPTFSSGVETNVARKFLKLVKNYFSKHRYHKILDKNNIKVSYSCVDNMEKLIKKHNNYLLRKDTNKRNCNCCANNTYPLDGKCLSSNIVHSAEVLIGNNQQETNTLVSARQNSKPV